MAGGGGQVVPHEPVHDTQAVKSIALASPLAEVAEQRQGLLSRGGGSRAVTGREVSVGQQHQRPSLPGPIAGPAGPGQGGLMQGDGLVKVAPEGQEAGHGGGDQHGGQRQFIGRRIIGCRVQVGALGLQPGGCPPERGQPRRARRRAGGNESRLGLELGCAGWRPARCTGSNPAAD